MSEGGEGRERGRDGELLVRLSILDESLEGKLLHGLLGVETHDFVSHVKRFGDEHVHAFGLFHNVRFYVFVFLSAKVGIICEMKGEENMLYNMF